MDKTIEQIEQIIQSLTASVHSGIAEASAQDSPVNPTAIATYAAAVESFANARATLMNRAGEE